MRATPPVRRATSHLADRLRKALLGGRHHADRRQGRNDHVDRRRRIAPQRGHRPPAPRVDLDDVIYGIHAVNEALVAGEPLRRIHVGDERKSDPALRNLLERARSAEVQVRFENRTFFGNFPYKAHQSVVAYGAPFDYITLEEATRQLPRSEPAACSCCSIT